MIWKIAERKFENLEDQFLFNRGIVVDLEKKRFFDPKIKDYLKDLEIDGLGLAVARLKLAIKNQEMIVIYGDYDVDGLSATTIMYRALSSLGAVVRPFVPHRDKDGYGLSVSGFESIRADYPEARLIVTVDNGIVAIEQAKYAKEHGFELIITDHHLPLETLPEASAIVHSTKMCGAAVAWCLARKLVSADLGHELMQLAAIGTIADLLPLIGVNRAIVAEGLKILQDTKLVGLKALVEAVGLRGVRLGTYEIGHMIAPKLNAAGRMDSAMPALKLLCTDSSKKADEYAKNLMEANVSRQELTIRSIEEANQQIDQQNLIHVVYSSEWISGIIGLVAGRLVDNLSRPVIAISVGQELAKGSARSIPGINIVEVLRMGKHILLDVGGHAGAAGFSLLPQRVEELKLFLVEKSKELQIEVVDKVLEVDAELARTELNKGLLDLLEKFAPFGMANEQVVLVSRNLKIEEVRAVGDRGKHLKLKIEGLDAIGFNHGEKIDFLKPESLVDVAYNFELNVFNGRESLQIKIMDIKLANG